MKEKVKYPIRRIETQLGITPGLIRNWVLRGTIPLSLAADGKLNLTSQHALMLLAVVSFFKVNQKVPVARNGMGTGPSIAMYWANLEECFRFLKIAQKEFPTSNVAGWTYLKGGIPIVLLTRDGSKPDRLAMNLGESLETMRKDLKKQTFAEVHRKYELQKA